MFSSHKLMSLIYCFCCYLIFITLALSQVQNREQTSLQVDITKRVNCDESDKAKIGDFITVHYGGFLINGTKFDSSFERAKPFSFKLGVGNVIPGWDEGLQDICSGEERHLVVPAELAYGEKGVGDVIPPNATLLFDIVILKVDKEEERLAQEAETHRKEQELQRRQEEQRLREEEIQRQKAKAEESFLREQEAQRLKEEAAQLLREQEAQRLKEEAAQLLREQEAQRLKEEKAQLLREQEAEERRRLAEQERIKGAAAATATRTGCPDDANVLETQTTYLPVRCPIVARSNDKLSMHYKGSLASTGEKFDSSFDRNKPFEFVLGIGQVIAGWDKGVQGMCEGERRTLIVPSALAYGKRGVGSVIPPCSTLIFEIELQYIGN